MSLCSEAKGTKAKTQYTTTCLSWMDIHRHCPGHFGLRCYKLRNSASVMDDTCLRVGYWFLSFCLHNLSPPYHPAHWYKWFVHFWRVGFVFKSEVFLKPLFPGFFKIDSCILEKSPWGSEDGICGKKNISSAISQSKWWLALVFKLGEFWHWNMKKPCLLELRLSRQKNIYVSWLAGTLFWDMKIAVSK